MTNFDKAIEQLLENEGGYVNDESDTGGATKFGISKQAYPNEDIENLTIDRAKFLYKRDYWNKINGDRINDYNIVFSIFDFAVNAGVGTSAKLAQRIIGVDDDGIIGNNSIKKINEFNPENFVPLFIIEKVKYYIKICEKRPENKKFFFGWIRRTVNN